MQSIYIVFKVFFININLIWSFNNNEKDDIMEENIRIFDINCIH